jgi:NADH-quinone oxidoreductase subunit M
VVGTITASVVIFAAWYLLWMFQRVIFNRTNPNVAHFKDVGPLEAGSLIVLTALSIAVGVLPGPLLNMIYPATSHLLNTTAEIAANVAPLAQLFGR